MVKYTGELLAKEAGIGVGGGSLMLENNDGGETLVRQDGGGSSDEKKGAEGRRARGEKGARGEGHGERRAASLSSGKTAVGRAEMVAAASLIPCHGGDAKR